MFMFCQIDPDRTGNVGNNPFILGSNMKHTRSKFRTHGLHS